MTRRLFCGTLAAMGAAPPVAMAVPAPKVGMVRVRRLDWSRVDVLGLIYGQLAVHHNIRNGLSAGEWSITHCRSGIGMCPDRISLKQAQQVAKRLGHLPNWSTVDDRGNWESLQAYERMRDLVRAVLVDAGVRQHA